MNRRSFSQSLLMGALASVSRWACGAPSSVRQADPTIQFGLVTYLWGKDMDLATLLDHCEQSQVLGVELRTEHAHRVEPNLNQAERKEVQKRFADSPVTLVGYGSNAQFHEADPERLRHNIELTKQYIHLMHDCGGTGVKVKPNAFVEGVPHDKTIEQIGHALQQLAAYGEGFGQQIRVEVHGKETSQLPVIKAIFDVATHPNVRVCWNSNPEDLQGAGLDANFKMVEPRLGATVHVREMTTGDYPYQRLFELLRGADYEGWVLLEARTDPADKVAALIEQRLAFQRLMNIQS